MKCILHYNEQNQLEAVTPNGQPSILFENLNNMFGEEISKELYSLTQTEGYKDLTKSLVDNHRRTLIDKLQLPPKMDVTPDMVGVLDIKVSTVNNKLVYEPTVDGEKIGALRLIKYGDGYRVDSVTISEDFRGQGVGTDLYKRAINDLLKEGKSLYSLKVRAPFADKIWTSLVKDGIATKSGNDYKVSAFPKSIDKNGETDVETLGNYANSSNENLNREGLISAQNTAISFGVNNNKQLAEKLEKAFVKQGFIVFDKSAMMKAGYSEYEASKIMSDEKLQESIKTNFPKVKNTEFEVEYDADFIVPKSADVGMFGKLEAQNPYIVEKNKKPLTNIKTIQNNKIINKISDTEIVLFKSYPLKPKNISNDLQELFNTIRVSREDVLIEKYKTLQKVTDEIKKEVVEYGIDLKDISNRIYPINELKSFVQSLENYIKFPTRDFAKKYDDFFDITTIQTTPSQSKNLSEIIVETELSEYELFKNYGLIRKLNDLYIKVAKIDNLFDIYKMLPNSEKTIEEIQSKIPLMQVTDENTDSDILAQLYMYKSYLGVPIETKSNKQIDFIDIKEIIDNPYLKATFRGIELINDDPITAANADLYRKEKPKEVSQEQIYDDNKSKRLQALQNPEQFLRIESDYVNREDGIIETKNNTNTFLKINDSVYEQIYNYENLSFYKEVDSSEQNLSNVDFSKYFPLATSTEKIIEKTDLNKSQIEKINKDFFDCK